MHKDTLESFYLALALSPYETASSEAYGEMILEVNNTKATLLWLLESNKDHLRLVNACNYFTRFCTNIGDYSEKVISQAVEFVQRNSVDIELLIEYFQTW
jgi:hypothetical protein